MAEETLELTFIPESKAYRIPPWIETARAAIGRNPTAMERFRKKTWGQTGRTPIIFPDMGLTPQKLATLCQPTGSLLIFSSYGSAATHRGRGYSPSCYAARQCSTSDSRHDADRLTYLELLRQYSQLYCLSVLGYCLLSNHVHLIVVPHTLEALAQSLKQAHGRYASYWNAQQSSTGHVWQGRFYSCPLDDLHLWAALRYVELNPVRAGMVPTAESWRWSSAAAHCGAASPDPILDLERWGKRWTVAEWCQFLAAAESAADVNSLRRSTHTGRPLGTPEFIAALEELALRPLAPRRGGRPKKPASDSRQLGFTSVA